MLIDESGLVRAIKSAYKRSGYTVSNVRDTMAIYTENWFVKCDRAILSRKVLATIVEHMGMIPENDAPVYIIKDCDPQSVMEDVVSADTANWCAGQHEDDATMVPVTMQGYQIFQTEGGGACWGVPFMYLDMIKRFVAENSAAAVVGGVHLAWRGDGEAVAMCAVRKAISGRAKEWERAVWNALEGVDLHKEKV